jgi:hypothetical protein
MVFDIVCMLTELKYGNLNWRENSLVPVSTTHCVRSHIYAKQCLLKCFAFT